MATQKKLQTVMLVAGETSGDQHAANMFLALKKLLPNIQGMGMGGSKMREAGINIRFDASNIGVIGPIETLKSFQEIKRALTLMRQIVCQEQPDLLICIDYKEFNYKLAKHAKQCGIKVLFYIGPQVWAWRAGRAKKYGAVINMMAVIFPFEENYYATENVPVRYVGHPSIDKVHPQFTKMQAIKYYKLDASCPIVGLLPGSRQNEIKLMLPAMLGTANNLAKQINSAQFILPQADSVSNELLQKYLRKSALSVRVIKNQPYDVIQCCDAVLTASGTATLEVALLEVPMVIAYKLSWIVYFLGRLLVKTPFIGLPNIIAGKMIVKEYIQHQVTAPAVSAELLKILTDKKYSQQIHAELRKVKEQLGEGNGSIKTAELVVELLKA